jgi:hypothetical protein
VTSEVTITIRSAIGSEISSKKYADVSKVELNFPKPTGLYFVEIKEAKNNIRTLKILKK